jgi:hypothetical protein
VIPAVLPNEWDIGLAQCEEANQLSRVFWKGQQLKVFCRGEQLAAWHRSGVKRKRGFSGQFRIAQNQLYSAGKKCLTSRPENYVRNTGRLLDSWDMRIGYARVSTEDQTLDLQRDSPNRAKCRPVYEEQSTIKNTEWPQLEACLKGLREGDTLVVWRLDRLGRNLADLVGLIAKFKQRKINFESLREESKPSPPPAGSSSTCSPP